MKCTNTAQEFSQLVTSRFESQYRNSLHSLGHFEEHHAFRQGPRAQAFPDFGLAQRVGRRTGSISSERIFLNMT